MRFSFASFNLFSQALLLAGTDTSSATMEWVSLLFKHPEAMTKVCTDLNPHVTKDRLLVEQDVPKLNYLQDTSTISCRTISNTT